MFVILFVPEEILALGQLLSLRMGREDGLQRIGVETGIEHLGSHRHRGRCEVLNLFQFIAHLTGNGSQIGHVSLRASRMAGDEVGDNLLAQSFLAVDAVEDALELIELLERWLAHQFEHVVAGMFRSHLQSSADMSAYEFTRVLHSCLVGGFVLALMQQQVVTNTTADEALLDAWQRVDSMIDLQ